MEEEKNELGNRLENTLITKTFNVSGMPESIWNLVNDFCKEQYGDSRWTMIADLVRLVQEDFKYALLYEEIQAIKEQIGLLQNKEVQVKKEPKIKTFGKQEGDD